MPRAKKGQQKVSTLKQTTGLCLSRCYYSMLPCMRSKQTSCLYCSYEGVSWGVLPTFTSVCPPPPPPPPPGGGGGGGGVEGWPWWGVARGSLKPPLPPPHCISSKAKAEEAGWPLTDEDWVVCVPAITRMTSQQLLAVTHAQYCYFTTFMSCLLGA